MYSTPAIMLRKIPVGEADGVVVMYTLLYGKMKVLAQGVKKQEAKLKGHIEPFTLASIQFVLGKYGERLTQAIMVEGWPRIRADWERGGAAAYMAAMVDVHCLPGQHDRRMWDLLLCGLTELEQGEFVGRFLQQYIESFEYKFLAALGYEGERDMRTLGRPLAGPFMLL